MSVTILFSAAAGDWPVYRPLLDRALHDQGIAARLTDDPDTPKPVDYLVGTADGPARDFTRYPQARAFLSLWAGVEKLLANPTLTQPLVRMVDPEGLTAGMVEWVCGHVLRHHLGMDRHIRVQDGVWSPEVPPLARDRRVAVLGLGELGAACARALSGLGFDIAGWSRTPRTLPAIACHSGAAGLRDALTNADIVVLLLPQTPRTVALLDAKRIGWLAPGAVVINPGRGGLIDDAALLSALDDGRLGHATLDVFRTEPLPADHPFWAHPRVTVTPHVASATRPASASRRVAEAIAALETGRRPAGLVDRAAGY